MREGERKRDRQIDRTYRQTDGRTDRRRQTDRQTGTTSATLALVSSGEAQWLKSYGRNHSHPGVKMVTCLFLELGK